VFLLFYFSYEQLNSW